MSADALPLISGEDYEQHLANVDAAQILDTVLDLQPAGWGDEDDYYDREQVA